MSYKTDFDKIDLDKYWFDKKAADSAVRYIETHCYHAKGDLSGTPLVLEDWQKEDIIKPLFGWKERKKTEIKDANGKVLKTIHKRKYNFAYIEVPKKNGKSTLLSGIAQIFLDIEPEKGAELVGLAWGKKQASIIFNMVKKSVNASPRGRKLIRTMRNSILSNDGEKTYTVWSMEAGTEDGQSPNLVICDELHQHKNGDLIDLAEKSMMARSNPLSLVITTAGDNLNGVGYERRLYAEKVAKGLIQDESLLVCVYCAEPDDDIFSIDTWAKANPNYGVSVDPDLLAREAEKARLSVAAENSFKRFHLNIWNNSRDQFIADTVWAASEWDFDVSELIGKPCFGGLDLAINDDITAFSLVFPLEQDRYVSLNWFFLPEERNSKVDDRTIRQYSTWVRDGLINETPGNVTDYAYLTHKIFELAETYQIQAIAYDRYNANQTVIELEDKGLNTVPFGQGYVSMSFPTKELERLVMTKGFNHLGNPVLKWMNSNASVQSDAADNVKLIKTDDKLKIDGMISNVMALGLCLDPKNKPKTSYLEETDGEISTL